MKFFLVALFSILILFAAAKTYEVGPGKTYTAPSQVTSLVVDGDMVLIDAGTYSGDVCVWSKNNLTIKGVGGLAHMKADGAHAQGKAIWVVTGNNLLIENIEFSGCTVPDHNGAGIRQEGTNVYIKNCYFHDNENGILTTDDTNSTVIIDRCEFEKNGYGDGYTHNMYINHIKRFVLKFSYTHHAHIGHNVKSRAHVNEILYNRIMDESTGDASMLLDLPNGGFSVVLGNVLMQGPDATNKKLITYGTEGLSNPSKQIFVVNNTLVNERHTGTFVFIANGASATIANNIFAGTGTAIEGPANEMTNFSSQDASTLFFKDADNYDFHLTQNSPGIDSATDLGYVSVYPLSAYAEYKHKSDSIARTDDGKIDIGAFEYSQSSRIAEGPDLFINLYPNPCQESFVIETKEDIIPLEVKISSIDGKTVMYIPEYKPTTIIDITGLRKGMYLVAVKLKDEFEEEIIVVY